ncbi:MAG: hypothetical protein KAJ18_08445 [Candidatus Omnitrophica bacterium]|nr:hypothetical protein [Candidatus Omnitrophota bacterium]
MCEEIKLKEQREYAWNYFHLHAGQRMSAFNFFIIISGLLATALVKSIHALSSDFLINLFIGLAISIGLCLVPFVFWKLDQRISYLIKHAEEALKEIENVLRKSENTLSTSIDLFSSEEFKTDRIQRFSSVLFCHLTYSKCFMLAHLFFGLVGFICFICFIWKIGTVIF